MIRAAIVALIAGGRDYLTDEPAVHTSGFSLLGSCSEFDSGFGVLISEFEVATMAFRYVSAAIPLLGAEKSRFRPSLKAHA
jgi:hypothetical protein